MQVKRKAAECPPSSARWASGERCQHQGLHACHKRQKNYPGWKHLPIAGGEITPAGQPLPQRDSKWRRGSGPGAATTGWHGGDEVARPWSTARVSSRRGVRGANQARLGDLPSSQLCQPVSARSWAKVAGVHLGEDTKVVNAWGSWSWSGNLSAFNNLFHRGTPQE